MFDAARDWLKEQGMQAMDGPINLGDRNMFWGLLIDNFTDPPLYGTSYNPPYYRKLLEHYGFALYFNQLFFKRSVEVPAQPIFHRKYNQLKADPDITIHDARGRSVDQIADDFCTIYNDGWVDHDNHKAMELSTALKIVKAMKPVMDPRLLIFVRHKDRPIAMYISLPELNDFRYVNGDLNWLGKLKFLMAQMAGYGEDHDRHRLWRGEGIPRQGHGGSHDRVRREEHRGTRYLSGYCSDMDRRFQSPNDQGMPEPGRGELQDVGDVPLPLRPHHALLTAPDHNKK